MSDRKVERLIFDSYLAVVRNSVGARLFRNFYARIDGKKRDVMRDGELSCAFYVSSVLALFGVIERMHATVTTTVQDMQKSGWQTISRPRVGSVLVWEAVRYPDGELHKHIGFYVGKGTAISNSSTKGVPSIHHWQYKDGTNKKGRKVEMILWYPKFS